MKSVLLKIQGRDSSVILPMPLTIGSSSNCDILVPGLVAHGNMAFVIYDAKGTPEIRSLRSGELTNPALLETFGIKILGSVDSGKRLGVVARFLAREKQWAKSLSPKMQKLMLLGLPDTIRYSAFALVIGALAMVAGQISMQKEEIPNHSSVEHALQLAVMDTGFYGNVHRDLTHPEGAKFTFATSKDEAGKPLILNFHAVGLDKKAEIEVWVNGQSVFQSDIEPECVSSACAKIVPLPENVLKVGPNTLQFIHKPSKSTWLIGKLLLKPLQVLDEVEKERLEHFAKTARDYYDERKIASINLIYAHELVGKIEKLTAEKSLDADTEAKIEVLRDDVKIALEQLVHEAWEDVETKIRLSDFSGAESRIDDLKKLFPDTSTEVGLEILRQTERINGLK